MTQSPNTPSRVPVQESRTNGNVLSASFIGVGFVATGVVTAAEASVGAFALPANFEVAATFAVVGTGILAVDGIRRAIQTRRRGVDGVSRAS